MAETNVNITFKISNEDYKAYEYILQDFITSMAELGYEEIDVTEKEE